MLVDPAPAARCRAYRRDFAPHRADRAIRFGRRREPKIDPLSPQDASFLEIEDEVSHMHIGSVGVYEGPAPSREELLDAVQCKLHLVPRYRQKVRYPPLHVGPPVWLDDSHFNLEYHVRRTALASPGGEDELRALTGRVMSQQLDRTKPLWEMWAAEGLGGGRWAVISKTHHCMVDGVSATDLMSVLLDSEREPTRTPPPRWIPEPEPSSRELVSQPLARRLTSPVHLVASAAEAVRGPRDAVELALQTLQGTAAMRSLLRPTPRSSLNGSIGPHRRWDWAHAQLSDVKTVRAGLGGTINDVVLTVISRGFRDLLISRGEDPARLIVRSLVPVSVRRPGERGAYNNRVSAMFAQLPVGVDDPVKRLESVRAQMDGLKRSHEAVAGEVLTSLSGFAPALLLALGMRAAFRMPQRSLNTVTTNVPGPQRPLFLAGRRLLEAIPFVPLAGHVRVGVAIFSYDGSLKFGVTGDYDTAPDIRILCEGIEQGMAELIVASGTAPRRVRKNTRRRTERVS
jgi:diacylglycerol O-acyltransferase / wax synthase